MRWWLPAAAACVLSLAPFRNAMALTIDVGDRAAVVESYRRHYLEPEAPDADWTGDLSECDAGAVQKDYLATGLRRINWFRAMAGLPPIERLDPSLNEKCQKAALLMTANRRLSHTPERWWSCYSEVGADAASKSNLGAGYPTLVAAVSGWIRDQNTPTGGHRRWILYPPLRATGLGATFGNRYPAYVMWVSESGARPATPEWVAWPPRGYVPHTVVGDLWSFAYPGAKFARARVSLTRGGKNLPVTLHPVRDGFGDNAILWTVRDWDDAAPKRDQTYTVTVSNVTVAGTARRFTYNVKVIDADPPEYRSDESAADEQSRKWHRTETTSITFELTQASEVHVGVYDARGRLLRTLVRGRRSAGKHEVTWDGLDAEGNLVPAGTYKVRLRAGAIEAEKQIRRS